MSLCLFWRNVFLDLLPIFLLCCLFFLILSYMSYLYLLEINPLSVTSFANSLSHSVCCLCLWFSFRCAKKFLGLASSYLLVLTFIFITLGGERKMILLWFMSRSVRLPVFSRKSFMVSGLKTFIFLMHPQFIYVYSVIKCSNFILLTVAVQFLDTTYWDCLFSTV